MLGKDVCQMSEAEKTSKKDSFFKRVKAEFKRCTWPKKDELIRQSTLVIVVSVILGGVIAGIDWLIRMGLQAIGL
jgi:preprotein translocase subunit SecE